MISPPFLKYCETYNLSEWSWAWEHDMFFLEQTDNEGNHTTVYIASLDPALSFCDWWIIWLIEQKKVQYIHIRHFDNNSFTGCMMWADNIP